MKQRFSVIGIVLAMAGIGVAVFQEHIRNSDWMAKPVVEEKKKSLKARIIEKGLKIAGLEKRKDKQQDNYFKQDAVTFTYMLLGFLGIMFGVIGYLQKESRRFAAVAVGLGTVAIAWYFVLYAVAAAIFILVLGSLG